MSEQDEVEVEVVEEQSSQNDRVKLEKSIRKDIFLAAKMAHHIMKNVEKMRLGSSSGFFPGLRISQFIFKSFN